MPNLDLDILKIMNGDTEVLKVMQGDTKVWPSGDIAIVDCSFANVTSSISLPTRVNLNDSLTIVLTPVTHYAITSATILMGGNDVTSDVWDSTNKTITIASVTGDIVISGTTFYEGYSPAQYIETTYANRKDIPLPYYPNNKTKFILDYMSLNGNAYCILWGQYDGNPNNAGTSGDPRVYFWKRFSTTGISKLAWGTQSRGGLGNTPIINTRATFEMDCGTFTYTDTSGSKVSYSVSNKNEVWTSTKRLCLFGTSTANPGSYTDNGRVYGLKIWEEGVLLQNWIPVVRNSDSVSGLYDTVNYVFVAASKYTAG